MALPNKILVASKSTLKRHLKDTRWASLLNDTSADDGTDDASIDHNHHTVSAHSKHHERGSGYASDDGLEGMVEVDSR